MKRKFKRVSGFLLLLIMGFGLIIRPSAEVEQEDKYFTLELPSNEVDLHSLVNNYTVAEAIIYNMILQGYNEDDGIVYLDSELPVLYATPVENSQNSLLPVYSFSLYDNVTEDDLIFDIPDEWSVRNDLISEFGFDPFEGCNKGRIVLKEFEPFEIKDKTYEFDFTNMSKTQYLNTVDFLIMSSLLSTEFEYYDINYYFGFHNLDGKTVVKSQSLTNPSEYNYKFGNDITSDDNIEIDLTNGIKSSLNNIDNINITDQTKLVLKFAEKSYDTDTYVIDYTSIDKLSSNNFKQVWYKLYEEDLVDNYYDGTDVYSDGELLLSVEKPSYEDYEGMVSIAYHKDFDASDNAVFDVSNDEFVQEELSKMGITGVDYLSFLFKKLELKLTPFEGEEKIKTAFTAADSIKFRLDLDYQKYKDELKIYIDEKELTKDKDYTLSEGSIIVTLADKFTNELELGSHTFSVNVAGGSLEVPFTISATEEKTDTKTETTKTANPKTGDNIFGYLTACIISIGGAYVTLKKLKNN